MPVNGAPVISNNASGGKTLSSPVTLYSLDSTSHHSINQDFKVYTDILARVTKNKQVNTLPLYLNMPVANRTTRPNTVVPFLGSVGASGKNRTSDVRVVQRRLADLGFQVTVNGVCGTQTETAIRIFTSIVEGHSHTVFATAKLRPNDAVTRRLFSDDAPRWVKIEGGGVGWKSIDGDGYDWATDRTLQVINEAGAAYQQSYRNQNPKAALLKINDTSRRDGSVLCSGAFPEHTTHQNGLDIDLRLPKKPGSTFFDGPTETYYPDYDSDAAYAMVDALASNDNVERILLWDPALKRRAITEGKTWAHKLYTDIFHRDHMHVDIKPPIS